MCSKKPVIFYFRSLDTVGRDDIRFGLLHFGTFATHFKKHLNLQALDFVPVLGMGAGPLYDQAKRAKDFLKNHPLFQNPTGPIHFFGHSAGGLVAKLVAEEPKFQKSLQSLVTIGTPHRSCQAVEWAARLPEANPKVGFLYKILGYDFSKKKDLFLSFQQVAEEEFRFPKQVLTGSFICAPPKEKWSWLYRWIHKIPVMKEFRQPSDGLIQKDAQYFGDHHWEFELDHIQQIGFGGQKQEFLRLCRFLETLWLETENFKREEPSPLQIDQSLRSRAISFNASFNSARDAES